MTELMDGTRSFVLERNLPFSPAKIWRALTEAPLIQQWLLENDFQPVVGHRFRFRDTARPHWNGVIDCEVLTVEPHKRLAYSWNASGEEAVNGLRTVVTWTLAPANGGTHVRMEQSGFRPEDEANYQGAGYGWPRFIDGLQQVTAGLG